MSAIVTSVDQSEKEKAIDYIAGRLALELNDLAAGGHLDVLALGHAVRREQDSAQFRTDLHFYKEFHDRRQEGCQICGFKGYGSWLRAEGVALCDSCAYRVDTALTERDAERRKRWGLMEELVDSDLPPVKPLNQRVYIAREKYGTLIKIGISARLNERMKALRADLLFTLDHDEDSHAAHLERELHERFAVYREQGEWFRYEGELAAFVEYHQATLIASQS